MPRKVRPRPCFCGCGELTKGGKFLPGHDSKLLSALIDAAGGLEGVRTIIEKHVGHPIAPEIDNMTEKRANFS